MDKSTVVGHNLESAELTAADTINAFLCAEVKRVTPYQIKPTRD